MGSPLIRPEKFLRTDTRNAAGFILAMGTRADQCQALCNGDRTTCRERTFCLRLQELWGVPLIGIKEIFPPGPHVVWNQKAVYGILGSWNVENTSPYSTDGRAHDHDIVSRAGNDTHVVGNLMAAAPVSRCTREHQNLSLNGRPMRWLAHRRYDLRSFAIANGTTTRRRIPPENSKGEALDALCGSGIPLIQQFVASSPPWDFEILACA